MAKIKERASGSLSNRRKQGDKVIAIMGYIYCML